MNRTATIERTTGETDVRLTLGLEGSGAGERNTAVGSELAAAVAGGAEGETILGADAPALGTFTRGIFAAGMAGPRTTWNRPREASSP